MITWTGVHITKEFGAPNVRDMAVQGMRICRFAGAFEKYFWPIGMHSLLVADLLPRALEHHGLLHDVAAEIIMCDIPRPHKTFEQKAHEKVLLTRTYVHLGLDLPTEDEADLIHEADMKAVCVEGAYGCGPRGFADTQSNFSIDVKAHSVLKDYLAEYDPADYLNADGFWSLRFERRLRRAIYRAKHVDYSSPA